MIILEGPDRCGKTTVAQYLRRNLHGWGFRHHTRIPAGLSPYSYFGWFFADCDRRVVVDRCHISEQMYRATYGDEFKVTAHEWRLLELMILAHQPLVLFMSDNPERVRERWDEKEMYDAAGVTKLMNTYEEFFSDYKVAPYGARYKSHLLSERFALPALLRGEKPTPQLRAIMDWERHMVEWSRKLFSPSVACGTPYKPDFMVIAEQPGHHESVKSNYGPHIALGEGPACEWFWNAMDNEEVPWWRGYYTNSTAFEDEHHLQSYLQLIQPKRICTLGVYADVLVSRANIEHARLTHPAYAKRFHHGDFAEWSNQLRQALMGA